MLWEGRTEFHAPEIDGKVYINDFGKRERLEAGRFYNAEITEAHEYDVVARVLMPGPCDVNRGIIVSMATYHISEAEAARDFAGVLARVREGSEVVIERDALAIAVISPANCADRVRLVVRIASPGQRERIDSNARQRLTFGISKTSLIATERVRNHSRGRLKSALPYCRRIRPQSSMMTSQRT